MLKDIRIKRTPKRTATILVAASGWLGSTLSSSNASAYTLEPYKVTNGSLDFYIDTASFVSNVAIPGLADSDYESWINWSQSNWRERTGANIKANYKGRNPGAVCGSNDGHNTVIAQNVCREPGCLSWANTPVVSDTVTHLVVDADVCVYGPAATWAVKTKNIPVTSKDLIGTLVHEFGHVWGLNHTPNTVMDSPTFNLGNTLARYPYGDDIDGIRGIYGGRTETRYYSSADYSSGIQAPAAAGGGTIDMHTLGGYGSYQGLPYLMATRLEPGGGSVHFTRMNIASPGSWTNRWLASSSWRPPAVTFGHDRWVAAWTNKISTQGCPGITIATSTDAFDSASLYSVTGVCTVHEPTLAYNSWDGRYVMTYAQRVTGNNASQNDEIMMISSLDGASWSAPQALGEYTIDAPDVSCDLNQHCQIQFAGGNDPSPWLYVDSYGFSGGTLSLTTSRWNYNWTPRTPAIATEHSDYWLSTLPYAGSEAALAAASYSTYYTYGAPSGNFGWTFVNTTAHRASTVGFAANGLNYILYVQ